MFPGEPAIILRMTLVEVTYELQRPLDAEQLRALGGFANTYGLRRFRLNTEKRRLTFEYDAPQRNSALQLARDLRN